MNIDLTIPEGYEDALVVIPDAARRMQTLCVGPRGVGKSMLLGLMAFFDFARDIPVVFIDPHGAGISHCLGRIWNLIRAWPPEEQQAIFSRIVYIDMGAKDRVIEFPLYYQTGTDSLQRQAMRLPEVILRLDPHLVTASIQGMNSVRRVGRAAGMCAAALGVGVDSVADMIARPLEWKVRIDAVVKTQPTLKRAAQFLTEDYPKFSSTDKTNLTAAFLEKIAPFIHDETLTARYGAGQPALQWETVVQNNLIVFIDLHAVEDDWEAYFAMMWIFRYVYEYVRRRQPREEPPLAVYIDELPYLFSFSTEENSLLTRDLDTLINRYARNNNVWCSLALQEYFQAPERLQKTLLSMGNQIFGGTTDMVTAKRIAERYARYTPHRVKDIHVQYDRFDQPRNYEFIYYTPEEQNLMAAQLLMETEPFRFLVGISRQEGQLASHLDLVSLAPLQSYYPVDIVNQIKADLMERDGTPVAARLQTIPAGPQQAAVQPSPQPEQPAAQPAVPETTTTPFRKRTTG